MFNFLYKYGRYKKINLVSGFEKIEHFSEDLKHCNLYRSYKNPMKSRKFEECLDSNANFLKVDRKVIVGTRTFDLSTSFMDKNIIVYVGKDLVFKLPHGYKGEYVYYRVEKTN